jgi:hypothetical protein
MARKESSTSREIGPDLKAYKNAGTSREANKKAARTGEKVLAQVEGGDNQYMGRTADYDKLQFGSPEPEYKKGGKVSSASSRADGCAIKGKTKGTLV